jgi:hypothetical protein
MDLLVANLGRLNEEEDTDTQGVFHILGVFENLLSFMPPLAEQVAAETSLLPWLLKRIAVKEYDSNKQYASEILAILMQDSRTNVMRMAELDGLETMLKVLFVSRPGLGSFGFTCFASYRVPLAKKDSNIGRRILVITKKSNSWRMCSTRSARHWPNQR